MNHRVLCRHVFVVVHLALVFSVAGAQFVPPNTNRETITINNNWKFIRSDVGNAQARDFNDAAWSTVHLPHSFNRITMAGGAFYRGVGWYRHHFKLDNSYQNKIITLYFEGAMTVATVWINGQVLPTHYGGFSPFCYDLTPHCRFDGTDNVIAVKLDNTYQKQVPPEKMDGSSSEFELYGGIYRDAYLIVTDKLHVPSPIHAWSSNWAEHGGHFVSTPVVNPGSAATVQVKTWIKNRNTAAATCKVITSIVDESNNVVQSTENTQNVGTTGVTQFTQTLQVASPKLWYPWAPALYTVYSVVYNGSTPVDIYKTTTGIRKVTFDKAKGVYCNGVYFKILGLNRHQMWPFICHAVPNNQQRRDAQILKEVGCNFVRCSHYKQDDAFLDECDKQGIFLWEEIPGWHTGSAPENDAVWRSRHYDETRNLVRTARNHPSIMIWGPAINEAEPDEAFERLLNSCCKSEDSTRPTSMARNSKASTNVYDIYGDNKFKPGGLPSQNPDPATLTYLNTEHTGYTYQDSSIRATCPESQLLGQGTRHALMTSQGRDRAWQAGSLGWCAFDYFTNRTSINMKNSGVMDVMHIKKFAYYFYQSQTAHHNYDGSKSPMVHIANYYRSNSPLDRRIYTNCDSVRLFQNGTRIGTAKPDAGWNLAHPPVTFKGVNFVAGMLSAEGFIGGKVVARDSIRSPGTPSAIKLIADPDTIEANGSDISRIEAYVVDNNGTWIQYSSNPITFTCSGKGECIGDSPLAAQSGACITLAQAGLAAGAMTITASSSGLTSASVTVTVKNVSSTKNIGNRFPGNSGVMSRSTTINVKTLGNIIRLIPQVGQYGSNPFLVSVYDLNGKLLYKKITSERTIDLRKEIHRSEGITIVKSQPVESSLPANRN